jgi:hypothetical protein
LMLARNSTKSRPPQRTASFILLNVAFCPNAYIGCVQLTMSALESRTDTPLTFRNFTHDHNGRRSVTGR